MKPKTNATVKWWNDSKGYGFVTVDGDSRDVFTHYTALYGVGFKTLLKGQRVYVEIIDGPKGPQASKVTGWDDEPIGGRD